MYISQFTILRSKLCENDKTGVLHSNLHIKISEFYSNYF